MAAKKINSILQSEKVCFVTGREYGLHKHHIFGGPNRKISEREGFCVYLIPELHSLPPLGVHFDHEFDLELNRACQREYEKRHTRAEFMRLIGRNYLDD